MKTVVTGGAGFIGSFVVDGLVAEGHEVLVIDDLSSGNGSNLSEAFESGLVHLEVCDVCAPEASRMITEFGPEVVLHLAAQVDVQASIEDPVHDAHVNVLGTVRVLEGARRSGARKVVLAASGGTLYGDPDPSRLPLGEDEPHAPLSPYGVSKMAAVDYLVGYEALYGLAGTSLALANVYGPRQDPHGEAGVVAIFANRLLAGELCTVFGDGAQTRDFIFVADVANAFLAATRKADGRLLNIGTGIETSVNDLYRVMAASVDGPEEPSRESAKTGEIRRSALNPAGAIEALDWSPSTELAAGVAETLTWFAGRK